MIDEPLFIRPNLTIEGLVDQFYAWTYLLSPAASAMNLVNLQLPMLDSYLEQPRTHADAVANPRMKGGFFVDHGGARLDEIKALRDHMSTENTDLVALASAVKEAEDLLRAQADGYDLTPLYGRLPASLRGYVELVYDRDHHASLRFLEAALYRSPYYRESRQSVELMLDDGGERPFFMSTPRLPQEGHLQLPLPLRHPGIDTLFAMRSTSRTFKDLREALEISDDRVAGNLRAYLTDRPLLREDVTVEDGCRIRYFGHACLVLQTSAVSIVVDPFVSGHTAAEDRRFTYADLPEHIDYCLITHGHPDHTVLETLLQIRARTDLVVVPRCGGGALQDPSLKRLLENLGFTVEEVDDFDVLDFEGGEIVATPFFGEHCDLDVRSKSTYWIRLGGKTVFVDADSSGVEPELYGHIARVVGRTDIAFLGMECDGAPLTWMYGGLLTQPVSRRMSVTRKLSGSDAAQALGIIEQLGCSKAYVYAMGEESWLQHVMAISYTPESYQLKQVAEFLDGCAHRGIEAEHLLVRKELRW
ncbi:MBL fold metallo-hydrolase [Microbispora sp. H10670]|uniref:MBL fold metallo-hydrolase n=1 Tax=Microbispora sp. H10670 TaxID=2729108 RepID=UPI0016031A92|nr:MBL fold metallo-hydrolase [Microbispora sp. H10670]